MKPIKGTKTPKQQVREILDEELILFFHEEYTAGRVDEDFMKHLKSAGKGIVSMISTAVEEYAKTLDHMVNNQMLPAAMGAKIKDKLEDVPTPEEIKGEDPRDQADAAGELSDLMQATSDAANSTGSDEAADKVGDMADAVGAIENAADKKADEAGDTDDGDGASLKSINKGKMRAALNQLGNKGLSGDKVGNLFDKASDEISKMAGPMRTAFEKEDRPVIDAVKDQVVAILKGDFKSLREQKIHPDTKKLLKAIHSQILEMKAQKK